jgi:hypothetical protein
MAHGDDYQFLVEVNPNLQGEQQEIANLFAWMAQELNNRTMNNAAQRTQGMHYLLLAKDCMVRATLGRRPKEVNE